MPAQARIVQLAELKSPDGGNRGLRCVLDDGKVVFVTHPDAVALIRRGFLSSDSAEREVADALAADRPTVPARPAGMLGKRTSVGGLPAGTMVNPPAGAVIPDGWEPVAELRERTPRARPAIIPEPQPALGERAFSWEDT